jgi:hypothetical protein
LRSPICVSRAGQDRRTLRSDPASHRGRPGGARPRPRPVRTVTSPISRRLAPARRAIISPAPRRSARRAGARTWHDRLNQDGTRPRRDRGRNLCDHGRLGRRLLRGGQRHSLELQRRLLPVSLLGPDNRLQHVREYRREPSRGLHRRHL